MSSSSIIRSGLRKALYANEFVINYLLNFLSQGGRGLKYGGTALHPRSSCLSGIKVIPSDDGFGQLMAQHPNDKVISLL